jgi:hypothetical protein
MSIDFGSDYSTIRADGTYGMTYTRINGTRVPLEGVIRMWLTMPANPQDSQSQGDMPWDRTAGFDITRLENSKHAVIDLNRYAEMLRRQALNVDFVSAARVKISQAADLAILIEAWITLSDRQTHPLLVTASQAAGVITTFASLQ